MRRTLKAYVRSQARRAADRIRRLVPSWAVILVYHRVIALPADPLGLCVSPAHFSEHLEALRRLGRTMTLQDLVARLRARTCPPRGVVVTFDDGYRDILTEAQPLLDRHAVPATVFITSRHLGAEREYWWDELDRLLEQRQFSERVRLTIRGEHRDYDARDPSLYPSIHADLHPLPPAERAQTLEALRVSVGLPAAGRSTHRTLAADDLARLNRHLIEIGAHGATHADLTTLPPGGRTAEISESKTALEDALGHPVQSFAYPYGRYNRATAQDVQRAGFQCACSAHPRAVSRYADRFALPRVKVGDWDGDTFARALRHWMGS